ncbi:AraC family transcriptional regulator [Limnoglobus roseus]|uniref:PAS domain-containing protein n=1 Tax=Limnoglobus roseus TaxID=2598579 RepID=A0A5C1A2A6_9BACT|nr:helix-turn-helix domain-containing protein [Limnoglobus roseus]QEL13239.1 PAS domain-containing protein [Limnoglobus roseus]
MTIPLAARLPCREAFFRLRADVRDLLRPFDRVVGLHYFVKDVDSRMVVVSPGSIQRMGGRTEDDVIGLQPHDYLPCDLADKYLADDRRVFQTGQPLVNMIEVGIDEQRLRDWLVTDKYPLHDQQGRVIGLVGTLQSFQARRQHLVQLEPVATAADYIRDRLGEPLRLSDIAAAVGYSERQLERLFHKVFGMTVRRFVIESRVHAAARELTHSNRSVTAIAMQFGFCDSCAFSHTFRKATGLSPKEYRNRHVKMYTPDGA